jgi:hypothetical protein
VKKFLVPLVAGVTVFGAVTAFAATLTLSGSSLGSGNATVSSCNSTAAVTYDTAATTGAKTYDVTLAHVTSNATCTGLAYKVTLLGASNASLGEVTGSLDTSGAADANFTSQSIAAEDVTGVSVVITG